MGSPLTAGRNPHHQAVAMPAGRMNPPRQPSMIQQLERKYKGAQEQVCSRLLLYEAFAGSNGKQKKREASSDDICEARRQFLDAFAYLCDVEKGGGTVTAAALQTLQKGNILWLAANEGIRHDVKEYAQWQLRKLKQLNMTNESTIREEVFGRAVEMCKPRIDFYKMEMKTYATICRMQLRSEVRTEDVKALRKRLKKLSEPPPSMTLSALIDWCYSMRGAKVETLGKRSKEEGDDFSLLAHYIGRLGATRSKANCVVGSFAVVPSLRQTSVIRTVDAPEAKVISIEASTGSPYELVRQICQETHAANPIDHRTALLKCVELDLPTSSCRPRHKLSSQKMITTWVHAELQVADKFSRNKLMEFVDNDMFIGCSKPACYFCYNWLLFHRHHYIVPATHQRILPLCRGPDNDLNESGAEVLNRMYERISEQLGRDIMAYLLEHGEGETPNAQPMSTNGTSRAPSRMGGF